MERGHLRGLVLGVLLCLLTEYAAAATVMKDLRSQLNPISFLINLLTRQGGGDIATNESGIIVPEDGYWNSNPWSEQVRDD